MRRLALLLLLATPAFAQAPGPVRLRGTVEAATETTLDMLTRAGTHEHILLPAVLRTTWVVPATLADIKPNSFIGTAAALQPDGTLRALEVHVFPPSMNGTGDGHRPYDLEGGGDTMTNGYVGSVLGATGRTLTILYHDGAKDLAIPENTPIVTYEPTTRAALIPGAKIVLNGTHDAAGSITAAAINIGKDGLTPPM